MPAFAWDTPEWQKTAEEAAESLKDHIKGKTILVTGVSPNSLGHYMCLSIAPYSPKLLVLASRTPGNLEACEKDIKSKSPNAATRLLRLDLADFDQVRDAAAEVMSWADAPSIDVLCNNAGISPLAGAKTMMSGIEGCFRTNHLGHFLFTKGVLPKVVAAAEERGESRVVSISSRAHVTSAMRLDDYNMDNIDWNPTVAYGQSKCANMLFTVSLARKLSHKGVKSFSVHPGGIMTNIQRDMTTADMAARGWTDMDRKPKDTDMMHWKSLSQGTSTHITACFDPSIADKSGAYLQDNHIETEDVRAYALDKDIADKLWKLSEELVGEKFTT